MFTDDTRLPMMTDFTEHRDHSNEKIARGHQENLQHEASLLNGKVQKIMEIYRWSSTKIFHILRGRVTLTVMSSRSSRS